MGRQRVERAVRVGALAAIVWVAGGLGGCTSVELEGKTWTCGDAGPCPPGQTCQAGVCRPRGADAASDAVPDAAADTAADTVADTAADTDAAADTDTDTDTAADTAADTDTVAAADTAPDTDAAADTVADTVADTDTDTAADTVADTAADTDTVAAADTAPDTDAAADTVADTAPDTDAAADTVTDTVADTDTDTVTDTAADTAADTDAAADTAADTVTDTDTDTVTDTAADTDADTDAAADTAADTVTDTATDTATDVGPGPPDGMVLVPGGPFFRGYDAALGSPAPATTCAEGGAGGDWCATVEEAPGYVVTVPAFYIDRHEASVGAYRACFAAGSCVAVDTTGLSDVGDCPNYQPGPQALDTLPDTAPMVCLTHANAAALCHYQGKRLCSESEWERAARGGDPTAPRTFPWGSEWPSTGTGSPLANCQDSCCQDGFGPAADVSLAPVDSFSDGATPEGILNLAGNASEWTGSCHTGPYPSCPAGSEPCPAAPGDAEGDCGADEWVYRGGNFADPESCLRACYRGFMAGGAVREFLGVRCCMDAPAGGE